MTDVAARAGVSKATLYRRWTAKADVVADAVATLSPMKPPHYTGLSLRDDLVALMEQVGTCDDRHEVVTATMEMARSHPELYRTLSNRSAMFVREELAKLAKSAADDGHASLSEVGLDVVSDTVNRAPGPQCRTGWRINPARTSGLRWSITCCWS